MSDQRAAHTDRVVVVAASAGGVEALSRFVGSLAADFAAAVLVVLHVPATGTSVLPGILSRAGRLPAHHAEDGERIQPGVVVVAPPNRHLVVEDGAVRLDAGPRENGHRPSADVLLRSAAQVYGRRCAGVVLSGTMDDGAAGLRAVNAVGGFTLVQDPTEAAFPGMPQAAINQAGPTEICSVADMGPRLGSWLVDLATDGEVTAADDPLSDLAGPPEHVLTALTCPDCGGALWSDRSLGGVRYRCRVGHAFSDEGLLVGKQDALEAALWAAIVALEERAELDRRILKRLDGSGRRARIERYEGEIAVAQARIELLRDMVGELIAGTAGHREVSSGG